MFMVKLITKIWLPWQLRAQALSLLLVATAPAVAAVDLAAGLVDQAEWRLSSRLALIDREFVETPASDRQQSALGLILDYRSGKLADYLVLHIAGYHAQRLSASGAATADLLSSDAAGTLQPYYSQIGEAAVEIHWPTDFVWQLGRQRVSSLQLSSSGQRALPDTYEGVSGRFRGRRWQWYGHWYNRWSPRNDDNFQALHTDLPGSAIDHLVQFGFGWRHKDTGVDGEWLQASGFLSKYGLQATQRWSSSDGAVFALTAGYFRSIGHGSVFRVGAESAELDDEDGAAIGRRSRHRGEGGFLQGAWERGSWRLGLAHSRFGNAWLEDNFAGDPGTNPFPTRSILYPDLTNTGERVWQLSLAYDWRAWLPGLRTEVALTRGRGAENSADRRLGHGDEGYREFLLSYRPPAVSGLSLQWRYQDYRSDVVGVIDGVKGDLQEHRLFIDYSHRF